MAHPIEYNVFDLFGCFSPDCVAPYDTVILEELLSLQSPSHTDPFISFASYESARESERERELELELSEHFKNEGFCYTEMPSTVSKKKEKDVNTFTTPRVRVHSPRGYGTRLTPAQLYNATYASTLDALKDNVTVTVTRKTTRT
jgi:hypothetical protein